LHYWQALLSCQKRGAVLINNTQLGGKKFGTVLSDILPAMNGGASHEEEGWRNAVNVV